MFSSFESTSHCHNAEALSISPYYSICAYKHCRQFNTYFFNQYFQSPFSFLMCFNNIHSSSLIRLYAHTPKTFLSPLSKYLCIHYQSQQCVLNDASFHLTVNSIMVRICCYICCLCYFAHFPILYVSQY